jgi:hypothetical protein
VRRVRLASLAEPDQFNYIIGEPWGSVALSLAEWCDVEAMVHIIETRLSGDRGLYGDIFVRCC